jgi:hypothetical protein
MLQVVMTSCELRDKPTCVVRPRKKSGERSTYSSRLLTPGAELVGVVDDVQMFDGAVTDEQLAALLDQRRFT